VTLNPRQFAAMAELGSILAEYGDKRDALKVLRKALAIDRHFANVDHEVQQLSREVEARGFSATFPPRTRRGEDSSRRGCLAGRPR